MNNPNMDQFLVDGDTGDALWVSYDLPGGYRQTQKVVRFDPFMSDKVIVEEGMWIAHLGDYGTTHIDTLADSVQLFYAPYTGVCRTPFVPELCSDCGEEYTSNETGGCPFCCGMRY